MIDLTYDEHASWSRKVEKDDDRREASAAEKSLAAMRERYNALGGERRAVRP
jgi:hypothetical protein